MGNENQSPITTKDIAGKLMRARTLLHCLNGVHAGGLNRLNYIEIGTAFKEDEGLSTLLAAKFIEENDLDGKVISMELFPEHIEQSREIVKKYAPDVLPMIEWHEGYSYLKMSPILESTGEIHLAFIDGGGSPVENLWEFDAILKYLSPTGVIVVDDCVHLKSTDAYPARRDFGKAQLILPLLHLADTVNFVIDSRRKDAMTVEDGIASILPHKAMSPFLKGLMESEICIEMFQRVKEFAFSQVGSQLVIARKNVMADRLGYDSQTNQMAIT
ncbi:class I SAM-dependent methyltransferase [Rubellicoccus peritrichatus]|uniref:Class I SAM-dependent methyltransferase n=1 Tax=Rubellicoccus peritrichatus TaxID=3080537 RepID=A0AAQ3QWR5_9BACT|nr:class I SAM-dependent methyltransferase [Puniceicoccus sp. CR14]WOO43008.1 class I SAM-dependent methyltransferase [Puniceicoccus sp. CR14]